MGWSAFVDNPDWYWCDQGQDIVDDYVAGSKSTFEELVQDKELVSKLNTLWWNELGHSINKAEVEYFLHMALDMPTPEMTSVTTSTSTVHGDFLYVQTRPQMQYRCTQGHEVVVSDYEAFKVTFTQGSWVRVMHICTRCLADKLEPFQMEIVS